LTVCAGKRMKTVERVSESDITMTDFGECNGESTSGGVREKHLLLSNKQLGEKSIMLRENMSKIRPMTTTYWTCQGSYCRR